MRPLGKAEISNMRKILRELECLEGHLSCILAWHRTLVLSLTIIFVICTLNLVLSWTLLRVLTKPSGVASNTPKEVQEEFQGMKAKYLEKSLANIPEISAKVGMLVEGQPGIPSRVPIFCGVSVLTKGTFVSKFLGYLYSSGSALSEEVAWRIFSAYYLCVGVIHIPGVTAEKLQSGRLSDRSMSTRVFRNPHYSSLPREGEWRSTNLYSTRSFSATKVPRGSSSTEPGLRRHRTRDIRLELMILATRSREYAPQGILVSLKQADEALRKGRNIQHEKDT
jgi:hypothetical protein